VAESLSLRRRVVPREGRHGFFFWIDSLLHHQIAMSQALFCLPIWQENENSCGQSSILRNWSLRSEFPLCDLREAGGLQLQKRARKGRCRCEGHRDTRVRARDHTESKNLELQQLWSILIKRCRHGCICARSGCYLAVLRCIALSITLN
jgi:hypothetical protein